MDAWPSIELQNLQKSLSAYSEVVRKEAFDASDDVVRALSRFLVVRSCGYLEQVSESCARTYLQEKSSPRTASFGASWLGRGRSPTPGNLVAFVDRFDTAWSEELQEMFDAEDERLSRDLSFLVDRRNKIAHGLNEGIGAAKALDLAQVSVEVADWFILRFDPYLSSDT